ncbi:AMP-binding protein [soil metagenome]
MSGSLTAALSRAAHTHGDALVVLDTPDGLTETSVAALHTEARAVAAGLRRLGVGPGDVVAVQLPNRLETLVAFQAVLLAGATLLPLVHVYGPREVGFILGESGARVLVVPDRWRAIDHAARVDDLRSACPELAHVVVVGEAPAGTLPWPALAIADDGEPGADAPEVAVLAYTSGTTANPKGVQHTAPGILAEIETQPTMLGSRSGSVQLVSFPAGHVAGVVSLLRCLVLGTPTIVTDGWDPARALELISTYGVTYTSGTPLHLVTLLDALEAGAPIGTLDEYLVGAATVPGALVARADALGIHAFRCYGSTEHPTITSGARDDPLAKRQHTDGRPTPGTEVRVVDEAGLPVAEGTDGEVVCRGPEQFVGYRDPGLDEDTWLPDRWLRTGDIGNLDAEGYLTITDRAKDVIIRAGETISSREVEDVLLSCPGVADAAVVAVPDGRYGERVGAFVVPGPGGPPDLAAVRAHFAAAGIARQKTPEVLEIRADLPRTPVGKVRKAELRDELRDELRRASVTAPGAQSST